MSTVTISLPSQIAKQVDSEAKRQGFATRSEFIRSLIRKHFTKSQFELEEFEPVPLNQLKMELAQTGKHSEEFINSVIEGFGKSSLYEN
ncbi:MAG: ribbon-helix-helix protein, CopG family [Candidatus Blackburnbacteria bacterium]|nr:ribbon-helix-helix protein, CopG family [Candidatus Blackburnbacteria bacterium]